jgi:hypothetical protein
MILIVAIAGLPTYAFGQLPLNNCEPKGITKILVDQFAERAKDANLGRVLEDSPIIQKGLKATNGTISTLGLALLFLGADATILPSSPTVQRLRTRRDIYEPEALRGGLGYHEGLPPKSWVRLEAQLRIRHPEELDLANCFGVLLKLAGSGVDMDIDPNGALKGVDVEWQILEGGKPLVTASEIVVWGRGTKPIGYSDEGGRTSATLFGRATRQDLTRVCVVPWERQVAVRLKYRVKARDIDDVGELYKLLKSLWETTHGDVLDFGLEMLGQSLWMSSPPIVVTVIDWKPCRWKVDITASYTDEQHVKAGVSFDSTRTYTFTMSGTQTTPESFMPVIDVMQVGSVDGSSTTRSSQSGKCQLTVVDTVKTGFPSGGTVPLYLEIDPDKGDYRLWTNLLPVKHVGTRTITSTPGKSCRGYPVSGTESVEAPLSDTYFFPISGRLTKENPIVGTYQPVPTFPALGLSARITVTYRLTPLEEPEPAPKGP